ncbi:MAG: hypothetical protein JWL86_6613 [Rhizobium sp.]|nr:hypothetical protein [Rhizobium sp.]
MVAAEDVTTRLALREAAERYGAAVDRRDPELFAAQFTRDGVLVAPRGRYAGHDELRKVPPMMAALYEGTFHGVLSQVAEIDGHTAKAETYCIARHFFHDSAGQHLCYEMTIRYQDDLVLHDGRWLFSRRELLVDFTQVSQAGALPGDMGKRSGRTE